MHQPPTRWASGFTLIEILIVLAIIGILLSIGYVGVQRLNAKYRLNDAQQTITQAFNSARSDARRFSLNRQVGWNAGSANTALIIKDEVGAPLKTINLQYGITFGTDSVTNVIYYAPYSRATSEGAAGTNFDIVLTEPRYGLTTSVRVIGVTGKVIRVAQ